MGEGDKGTKGLPGSPPSPLGSHGIVGVGFELCMCVKLLGGGGVWGNRPPWDSRGPQLSSPLLYGFLFNKNISHDVQHLWVSQCQIEAKINDFGTLATPIILN